MRVIGGVPKSGKTHEIVQQFLAKKNDAILLVPSKVARELIRSEYKGTLEFHGVDQERIVDAENLKAAIAQFKPQLIMIDNAGGLIKKFLALNESVQLDAITFNLDAPHDDVQVFSHCRGAKR
ncbi:MAG: hypothetical protein ACXVB1_00090 [Pseudobdellovibrionaceae bacterium]